ncbi:MAG TPA: chemotaxis protein CheW [Candidatus Limnocylindrales bacterium]|jgi:purine-binding chemotaxis protein CheW
MSEFQVVICRLGDESYGLDIGSVYEIIRFQESTAVPTAPSFVDGVINLRGRIIPVMDLSSRFGMSRSATTKSTRIVVAGTGGTRVGLVVDAVSEVLMLSEEAVEPTPEVASDNESAYIRGIARLGGELVILLDLSALFPEDSPVAQAA